MPTDAMERALPLPDDSGEVVVRPMVAEDIPGLAGLYRQFWDEDSDTARMAGQFERLHAEGRHIVLSAVVGGRLVGSVMGVLCEELYGDCRPFLVLENMVVDAACRNRRIGKRLIAELEAAARARGCSQILLVTETDRADACAFYASAGYDPASHRGFKKRL